MVERSLLKENESRYLATMYPKIHFVRRIDNTDLKPCPFCGFIPRLYFGFMRQGDDEANVYMLECSDCGISWNQLWDCDYIVDKWNCREGGWTNG